MKTIEEKAKRYDEAIDKIGDAVEAGTIEQGLAEWLFPELKESEDEQHRKWILEYLYDGLRKSDEQFKDQFKSAIAWLEKQSKVEQAMREVEEKAEAFTQAHKGETSEEILAQMRGEQKPVDKVKPKFHEGEWVILTAGELSTTLHIVKVDTNKKLYWFNDDSYLPIVDEECLHLWTIQDAKDGDVCVASDGSIFLFAGVVDCACKYYAALTLDNDFKVNKEAKGGYWETSRAVHPATKEQRDTLMEAMAEAGYEWDAEKKELKKLSHQEVTKTSDQETSAWSEEDRKFYFWTISNLTEIRDRFCESYGQSGKCIDWLKSLKDRVLPQNTWKPSNEQIKAIRLARSFVTDDFDEHPTLSEILIGLEEQLKKLKEE